MFLLSLADLWSSPEAKEAMTLVSPKAIAFCSLDSRPVRTRNSNPPRLLSQFDVDARPAHTPGGSFLVFRARPVQALESRRGCCFDWYYQP